MRKALCSLVVLLIVLTTIAGCNKQKSEVVTEPADSACSETTMAVSEEPSVEDSTAAVTESQTEEKKNFETTGTESTEPSETTTKIPTTQPTQETKPANTKPSETSKPAETSKPTEQTKPTETTQSQETTKPTEPVKPVHTHSYSKATCTKPATCSCGATNGKALGHQYASATCTKAATCTVCGATTGSALGHNYSNGKCTRCGKDDPNYKPPVQEFDINYWVNYAKNYAKSVGLILNPDAVECWDNPTDADAKCIYLERDLSGRLNRYAKDKDITDVWIWYEDLGNGNYLIYIGYA